MIQRLFLLQSLNFNMDCTVISRTFKNSSYLTCPTPLLRVRLFMIVGVDSKGMKHYELWYSPRWKWAPTLSNMGTEVSFCRTKNTREHSGVLKPSCLMLSDSNALRPTQSKNRLIWLSTIVHFSSIKKPDKLYAYTRRNTISDFC